MKICIIGYSGAGKSTLAKKLAELDHIPCLYLDTVQFEANWQERDRQQAFAMVRDFMQLESYVIDGNYRHFAFEQRMAEADLIIFLNFNRWACLYRALKRYFSHLGQARESVAPGCIEKFDWEFFKFIVKDQRQKSTKNRFREVRLTYSDKCIELKNQRQINRFLKQYASKKGII